MALGFAYWLYNYRVVRQGNDGICWAACMASIINVWKGTSYTAHQVADACGYGSAYNYDYGATYSQVQTFFSRYYGMSSSWYGYYLSLTDITSEINADRAIYQQMTSTSGDHSVVVMGYQYESDASLCEAWISIMDPASGGYYYCPFKLDPSRGPTVKTIIFNRSDGVKFTSGPVVYNIK